MTLGSRKDKHDILYSMGSCKQSPVILTDIVSVHLMHIYVVNMIVLDIYLFFSLFYRKILHFHVLNSDESAHINVK